MVLAAAGAAVSSNVPARAADSGLQTVAPRLNIPDGSLSGVAATSAGSAWAVGAVGGSISTPVIKTLLVHWNGKRWAPVMNPKPVDGQLNAVSAASANSVWAVGYSSNAEGANIKSLIMHWNGKM